jgi:tetratricopeptide (TPR) repeat protein
MIITLQRPEKEHDSWNVKLEAETQFAHRHTDIFLKRLPEFESLKLVSELLVGGRISKQTKEALLSRAEGNPLYLEEMISHFTEQGYIELQGNEWVVISVETLTVVPETLQGILFARIDQLEADLRHTLQIASVIGRSFMYKILEAIVENPASLDRHLSELQKRDLIRQKERFPELEYIFKHSLIQEAAYDSLLTGQRKEYHLRVAQVLENAFSERTEEMLGLIAHHFEHGGNIEQAGNYHLRAGIRAESLHSHLEALGYYDSALANQTERNEKYYKVLRHRGRVLCELFMGNRAAEDFNEIQKHSIETADDELKLEALLGLARSNYIMALDESARKTAGVAREYYEKAFALASELGEKEAMVQALTPSIWFTDFWPDYGVQARENALKALEISRDLRDDALILDARLAVFYTNEKFDQELAESLYSELKAKNNLTKLNELLFLFMWIYRERGEYEQAIKYCDEGIAVAKQIGVPPVQYPTIKALNLIDMGRFDEALQALNEEIADQSHQLGRAFREFGLSSYYLELMDFERAIQKGETALEQARALNRSWLQNIARSNIFKAQLLLGPDHAEVSLTDLDEFRESFTTTELIRQAELARNKGDLSTALEIAEEAVGLAEQLESPPGSIEAAYLKAVILLDMVRPRDALEIINRGIHLAEQVKFSVVHWRLCALKAKSLRQLGLTVESEEADRQASEIILDIADSISDKRLKISFLSHPSVNSVLERVHH